MTADHTPSTSGVDRIRALLGGDPTRLAEVVTATHTKWQGAIFRADRLDVTLGDGTTGIRDVVWHNGGAGVLAMRDGLMCLVRQWRVVLGRVTLEIPAGKVDAGEDGATAAARELAEETGLVAERLTLIANAAGSPGFTNEMTRIYRAHGLSARTAHPEEGEFVDVVWARPDDIVAAAAAGVICDAKTIIAAYAALVDAGDVEANMVR